MMESENQDNAPQFQSAETISLTEFSIFLFFGSVALQLVSPLQILLCPSPSWPQEQLKQQLASQPPSWPKMFATPPATDCSLIPKTTRWSSSFERMNGRRTLWLAQSHGIACLLFFVASTSSRPVIGCIWNSWPNEREGKKRRSSGFQDNRPW